MSDENDIIDVEATEIVESDNLPALIPREASNSESIELPNRQDTLLADNAERRCVAHKKNGERCRKFAIYGSTVCRTHGGATKRVREAARIRVENASDRLMGKLIEFAFDDTKPPDVQLKAIQNSLDRAGLKPPAEVVLSQGETKQPWEEVFDGIYSGPRVEAANLDASSAPAYADEATSHAVSEPQTYADSGVSETDTAEDDAPYADMRPQRVRRGRPQHITGDEALAIAASLRRDQLALESPHKRYPRP